MKVPKIVLAALVVFGALAFVVTDNSSLVKIIHKGKVIEVSENAVPAHLAHGDTLFNDGSSSSSVAIVSN